MTGAKSSVMPAAPLEHASKFNVVFVLSFAVYLVVACFARVLFLPWRSWFPGAEGSKSMWSAVSASVYTFMSYLN